MKKNQLINKIHLLLAANAHQTKGERSFLSFMAEYLSKLHIPADEKYDHWRIDDYLPEIIVAAHEQFREGQDSVAKKWRAEYEKEVGRPVPNLTQIGEDHCVHQTLEIYSIAHTFGRLMPVNGERNMHIERAIEDYCNAQFTLLQQTFDVFARRVYWNGLFEIIRKCNGRGMGGKFGKTTLRSYVIAGRIMFTFCREDAGQPEPQVSFVGEDTDPLLLSAGLQSVNVNIVTCMEMIMDVVTHWPLDKGNQKKAYGVDRDVKLDAVAAMEAAQT